MLVSTNFSKLHFEWLPSRKLMKAYNKCSSLIQQIKNVQLKNEPQIIPSGLNIFKAATQNRNVTKNAQISRTGFGCFGKWKRLYGVPSYCWWFHWVLTQSSDILYPGWLNWDFTVTLWNACNRRRTPFALVAFTFQSRLCEASISSATLVLFGAA